MRGFSLVSRLMSSVQNYFDILQTSLTLTNSPWWDCFSWSSLRPLEKRAYQNINFLISQPKHMLLVSMRRFFWAPKTYVKIDGEESIYNFTLKNFVYLHLWVLYGKMLFCTCFSCLSNLVLALREFISKWGFACQCSRILLTCIPS